MQRGRALPSACDHNNHVVSIGITTVCATAPKSAEHIITSEEQLCSRPNRNRNSHRLGRSLAHDGSPQPF